jgi:NADPH-dependent 7-cyano-7-deazaguanine reductase QueF
MSFEDVSDKLEDLVNEVLDPFNNLIKKKELNVNIIKQTEDNISIVINWKDY